MHLRDTKHIQIGLAIATAITMLIPSATASNVFGAEIIDDVTDSSVEATITHDPQVDTVDFASAAGSQSRAIAPLQENSADSNADSSVGADSTTLQAASALPGDAGLSSVAVSWTQSTTDVKQLTPTVMLRYQDNNAWSDWTELEPNIVESDDSGEPVMQATDPMYVGGADAVEARITFTDNAGNAASLQPKLTIIDSGYALSETDAFSEDGSTTEDDADEPNSENPEEDEEQVIPATLTPDIHTRESWWRNDLPERAWPVDNSGTWRGAIVHHTVDRNDYTKSEVKAIVQDIYIFHAQERGWGDIGYNLLVDRFGGIWEGRDEGAANMVQAASQAVGAHTSDFNYATFGVSIIGSFHLDDKPTEAAIQSVASVIAWEFNALGIVNVYDTFSYLGLIQQRITGHGDESHHVYGANDTLCPGVHVSEELPRIRTIVQDLLNSTMPAHSAPVYRLYNPNSGLHHYTTNDGERESLVAAGWNDEKITFYAQANDGILVYRLYNPNDGNHFWTTSSAERDYLVKAGWSYEDIGWYASSTGTVPVYRLYLPSNGEHLYTTNSYEYQSLPAAGWNQENIAWQGL